MVKSPLLNKQNTVERISGGFQLLLKQQQQQQPFILFSPRYLLFFILHFRWQVWGSWIRLDLICVQ